MGKEWQRNKPGKSWRRGECDQDTRYETLKKKSKPQEHLGGDE